ncbi:MAG TPA: hypothetical protein PKA06_09760 [Gemmatales bacterium]|nr:hypothetical protein [Gemmatales bacterium]
MKFAELPPSRQWSTLKYQGEIIAEVWFKPEGESELLTIRVPHSAVSSPVIQPLLTIANLLKSMGLSPEEVETIYGEDESKTKLSSYAITLKEPLAPFPESIDTLYLQVLFKATEATLNPSSITTTEVNQSLGQTISMLWNSILGIESTVDSLRQRMESLRGEMESVTKASLTSDEKLHAPNLDVAEWNKAKSRCRYVLPKVKEFIHRATWAMGTPERKKLTDLFKLESEAQTLEQPPPNLLEDLQNLLKDRQILSAQGVSAYQEGRASCDEVKKSLQTLKRNAHANAVKKRASNRSKW